MKNLSSYIVSFGMLLLASCASILAPNGGPLDTEAPVLLNKATVDSMLNFKGGTLVIEFDEFIKLDNLQKNFSISPLTKQIPKVTAKKKTLMVALPDSLLESNTTYNLSFGDAVRDLRENNPYKNLELTLSTGSYFDSLFLNGKIFDAQTGQGDSLNIMLYPFDTPDSMILKQRPLYVAKAQGGGFSFKGLPNKKFKMAALADQNDNYTYDALGEKIAFTNAIMDPENPDTALILYSFIEENMKDTTKSTDLKRKGRTPKPSANANFSYTFEPDIQRIAKMDYQDSLKIILGDDPAAVNTDKIRFYENNILDLSMTFAYDDSNGVITLFPHWEMGTDYRVVLQNGFLKDSLDEESKADTLNFRTMAQEDYASIVATVDSSLLQPGAILLLYLNGKEVGRAAKIASENTFELLKPETYTLKILYDENENGQWDSGNLKEGKQPERTIEMPKKITLRANWENKIEWTPDLKKGRMGR